MVIGTCRIELDLPGIHSLKQKRSCIKSLKARLHREFNVSVAEVDLHEVWQSSTLGAAVVSTTEPHAEAVLNNMVAWIEQNRPDVMVVDWDV
ncbi:MAG: DUF503 domain-containing protein, partial [Anaerolineae bacterium]|nr:DUF503 domain-containing protein [Anaerolineae bacterium]